jgi:acetyl esterase/lipase
MASSAEPNEILMLRQIGIHKTLRKRGPVCALLAVLLSGPLASPVASQSIATAAPVEHVYVTRNGAQLKVYIFQPRPENTVRARAAVILFHGGGWTQGEPQWAFSRARHFADLGLVAAAVQYRLSDEEKGITPVEAMADAREAVRWMRAHADSLGIDPGRIAAYGWSAGGHLAASAAIFEAGDATANPISAAPDALILVSPAVSLGNDRWAARLLGTRAKIGEISPDEHVRGGLPATLVLQGSLDTVTPLAGAKRFCDRMRAAGNRCELHVYEGFGHLFTPAGVPDDGWPKPDPAIQSDAMARADRFLRSLGFTE